MNKNKFDSQELIKKSVSLADSVTEIDSILEKLYVISSDVFENYIEKINLKTERGRLNAEIDFNIIKVMMDVIHTHIVRAFDISRKLPELSDNILEELNEKLQFNN
ncbi:MAG: hypothetical protein E7406_01220 [Ruminococcaceae bacterium]|nr:hypothetical protein [Oscillospiraceae bacterium]